MSFSEKEETETSEIQITFTVSKATTTYCVVEHMALADIVEADGRAMSRMQLDRSELEARQERS